MGPLHVHLAPALAAADFPRLARGLLATGDDDAHLLVAELTGEDVSIGRFQRIASALQPGARARAWRRLGGGPSVRAGTGVIGVALALPTASALLASSIGPDRILNRYVRGLDAGLTRSGSSPVHYFGRDHVVCSGRRLALVSQEVTASGSALFEALVAVFQSLALAPGVSGYPTHGDPRIAQLGDVALSELWPAPRSFSEVAEAIADGYAAVHGVRAIPGAALAPAEALPLDREEEDLTWSGVADVPIGFVEALVRVEGGVIGEARLHGDFLAPSSMIAALEQTAVGQPLDEPLLVARFHEVVAHHPHAFLLGIADVHILAAALVAAGSA